MSSYESYLASSLEGLINYIEEMESRPILFVGSGISQRYIGSPTWKELLEILIDENPFIDKPIEYFIQEYNGEYEKIASALVDYYSDYAWSDHETYKVFPEELFKSVNKNIYLKYKVAEIFIDYMEDFEIESNDLQEELELLKELKPHAIITTNYDQLMEEIFPKYQPIIGQEVIYKKSSTDIGHILKIHGSVDDIESIIIEESDYTDFYERQIYLIAKLFTYFVEHPIIFLGYSISDRNVQSILYNVKKIIDANKEPQLENIWIIDWNSSPIPSDTMPPKKKSISVGNGESVRVNYIQLHDYTELYNTLYQESIDINYLQQIEETIYNVIKSDSITNLEVDIASLHNLTDRNTLLDTITQPKLADNSRKDRKKASMFTFSKVSDPNELTVRFPLTATMLSERVFDKPQHYWSHAYDLINDVYEQTGLDLRGDNNRYHIRMAGFSRYSTDMVELLKKVKNNEPYEILNEDGSTVFKYPEDVSEESSFKEQKT